MKHTGFLPLDLQFFADGGEGAGAANEPANQPATPPAAGADPAAPSPANAPAMTPEAMAEAFANALTTRTSRAERSVAKSFAEQYTQCKSQFDNVSPWFSSGQRYSFFSVHHETQANGRRILAKFVAGAETNLLKRRPLNKSCLSKRPFDP